MSVKITKRHFAVATGEVHPRWFEEGTTVTDPQVCASAIAQGNGREVAARATKAPPAGGGESPANNAADGGPTNTR